MRKSIFIVSLFISVLAFGQTNNIVVGRLLKLGDEYFSNDQYMSALRYYKEALDQNESNLKAQYQIAECYRLVRDYESAEYYYEQIGMC